MKKLFFALSKISFHPKLAAVLDLFIGLVFVVVLPILGTWWLFFIWLAARIIIWAGFVKMVFFPRPTKRFWHWLSLVVFLCGTTLLMLFVEWPVAKQIITLVFVIAPATSFWFLPIKDALFSFVFKPYRRWQFMLTVFGLVGIISGLFAVYAFQLFNILSCWPYVAIGAVVSTAVACWWWREYGLVGDGRLNSWILVWLIINVELLRVLFLWPLGYLLLGILFIWLWYIFWLLIRFHLSKDGIVWSKQRWFLITNGLAILVYLIFLARWQ